MDADGSEFSQVFLMDPATGRWTMLTDGESRNHSVRWARDGSTIAWTSTARNGRSNDIWQMDPDNPRERQMIFESPDGTSWAAIDFARDGKSLLFRNYVSINDVRIHLLDLTGGRIQIGERRGVHPPALADHHLQCRITVKNNLKLLVRLQHVQAADQLRLGQSQATAIAHAAGRIDDVDKALSTVLNPQE